MHARLTVIAFIALLLGLTACVQAPRHRTNAPLTTVESGRLAGLWTGETGQGAAFLGVPFAMPPIGDARWRAPSAVGLWSATRSATAFAPACMQGPHIVDWYKGVVEAFGGDPAVIEGPTAVSEDCLYLNIWTPDLDPDNPAPVMVWIHGGSNVGGWSYEPNYRGAEFAQRGVVVVTITYRLGAFGYLGSDEDGDLNAGLLDQIAALRWVQDNIAAFGGDPEKVTIFGESAGAAAVGTLMTSPKAGGLFQRAVSQSGGFEFVQMPTRNDVAAAIETLQERFPGQDLRDVPAKDLLAATEEELGDYFFYPVVDGVSLVETPQDALKGGRIAPVNLLIGTNKDEWLMYLDAATAQEDLAAWRDRLSADDAIDRLVAEAGTLGALDRLETAQQMRCPGYALARAVGAQGQDAFVYLFTRVRPGVKAQEFGSYHGAEIPYVFGTHDDWLPTDETDWALTGSMMAAWVQFAKTGTPVLPDAGLWPAFGEGGLVQILDADLTQGPPLDADLCAVLARGTKTDE